MSVTQISGSMAYGAVAKPPVLPAVLTPAAVAKSPDVAEARPAERKQPETGEVSTAVSTLNTFVQRVAQSIEFSVDRDSGQSIVQVIDTETQKVLRQIPNEEALAIATSLDKLQGLLLHHQA